MQSGASCIAYKVGFGVADSGWKCRRVWEVFSGSLCIVFFFSLLLLVVSFFVFLCDFLYD